MPGAVPDLKGSKMEDAIATADWSEVSKGTAEASINGNRYKVAPIRGAASCGYKVQRNGADVTGPDVLGAPAGHKTMESAKKYAEWHADANS